MRWEFRTITIWRRYRNRERNYFWESGDIGSQITGWDNILSHEAMSGWELVSACVEGYQEGNTSMEAIGYRLFFQRELRGPGEKS